MKNIAPITDKQETVIDPEEVKESILKYPLSKFDYDLYDETDNKVEKIIRVKAVYSIKKGDKWKIFDNDKVVCVIDGTHLNKRERAFLKTVDGMNWMIAQAKAGIKSFNSLKIELKKKIRAA